MKNSKKTIIYFASSNKHKLKEIKSILKSHNLKSILLRSAPDSFSVNENGKTYLENAYKKAKTLSLKLNAYAFADDSGFEVEALGNKPGIKSARFFRNGKALLEILEKLKNEKNRKCSFKCAVVMTDSCGEIIFKTEKTWKGEVSKEISGKGGFGYDPIFYIKKLGKSVAEISPKVKNSISHRGLALDELGNWLKSSFI